MILPIEFETAIRNWKAATDGVTAVETAVGTEELGTVVVGGSMSEERN